jgi:hypothetical protein
MSQLYLTHIELMFTLKDTVMLNQWKLMQPELTKS